MCGEYVYERSRIVADPRRVDRGSMLTQCLSRLCGSEEFETEKVGFHELDLSRSRDSWLQAPDSLTYRLQHTKRIVLRSLKPSSAPSGSAS